MRIAKLIIFLAFFFSCQGTERGCPDHNCSDYTTQQEAQAAYDQDPDCLNDLDADHDGIACEHLPNTSGSVGGNPGTGSVTGCPTTSNCGCSNKTKSACGGPCCKWVTGSGCRCA